MKYYNEYLKKKKIKILIIVRLGSRRLKNKAKLKINNLSLVEILLSRLLKKFESDQIIICSSKKSKTLFFKEIKKKYKINIFFGEEKNIFKRILDCQRKYNFKHFIRVTGDNPLTDVDSMYKISRKHINKKNDYTFTEGLPRGMRPEIFSIGALKKCYKIALDPLSSEYLTFFFKRKEFNFSSIKIKQKVKNQNNLTITIDNKKDFLNLKKLIKKYGIFVTKKKIIFFLKKEKILTKNVSDNFKLKTKNYDVRFKK